MTKPLERDAALEGITYKIKWPASAHALYVTINDIVRDGRRRPFEIFINTKNLEHYAWTVALTRMISAVFRRGGDVAFVAEELKAVFDPEGGRWMQGRYVPSLLAAIGDVIEQHMLRTGFLTPEDSGQTDPDGVEREPVTIAQRAGLGRDDHQVAEPQTGTLATLRVDFRSADLPAVRRAGSSPHRRLLDVRQLHLFALRLRLQTPVTSRPPTHSSLGAGWPVKLGH